VVVFSVAVAALTGMTLYLKRGIQGTVHDFSAMVGKQEDSELITSAMQEDFSSQTITNASSADLPVSEFKKGGVQKLNFNLTQDNSGISASQTVMREY
jgi:hypothetical protein